MDATSRDAFCSRDVQSPLSWACTPSHRPHVGSGLVCPFGLLSLFSALDMRSLPPGSALCESESSAGVRPQFRLAPNLGWPHVYLPPSAP